MVIYVASPEPLPLIPWREDAPAFNVIQLTEHDLPVIKQFSLPYVRYAGSHEGCGCGFHNGDPEMFNDEGSERDAALKSSSELVAYIQKHRVEQVYSCWSGDESEPKEFERRITPQDLIASDFSFRERELLFIGAV